MNPEEIHLIIPAAGSGTRLREVSGDISKNLLRFDYKGKPTPLVAITVDRLKHFFPLITVVVSAQEQEAIKRALAKFNVEFITGGATRQESVFNALKTLSSSSRLVAIHDAARPLVSDEALKRVVETASLRGAALLVERVTSTVKEIDPESGRVVATHSRDRYALAQTPQVFRTELILEAHHRARAEGIVGTDDAQLVEALGMEVFAVENPSPNPKITTPADLAWAQFLLAGITGRLVSSEC